MGSLPPALSLPPMMVAGWVYRHQLIVIEFLQAENRLLHERLRGKRIRVTDAEGALLARKAKAIERKAGTPQPKNGGRSRSHYSKRTRYKRAA
jgi:hypothetical protein